MSNDDHQSNNGVSNTSQNVSSKQPQSGSQKRSLFSIPPPVKRIFDKFPLVTYPQNEFAFTSLDIEG